jgi:hypothetical protein
MPIMFNTLLREAGFPLCDVRLIRHADREKTAYELWHHDPEEFEEYQSCQDTRFHKTFNAPYWAVFLGTPTGKTLFVGIYGVRHLSRARGDDHYELTLKREPAALGDLIGRLYVDWGEGRGKGKGGEEAWKQYAHERDKPITELRAVRAEFGDD